MADERMWSYKELKHITVHQYKMGAEELAADVNRKFHGGAAVRTAQDVNRIIKGKTIFNRGQRP